MAYCSDIFRGWSIQVNGCRRASKVQHLWRHHRPCKPSKATRINTFSWIEQVKARAKAQCCKNRKLSKWYLGNYELEQKLYVIMSFQEPSRSTWHHRAARRHWACNHDPSDHQITIQRFCPKLLRSLSMVPFIQNSLRAMRSILAKFFIRKSFSIISTKGIK